MPDRATDGHGWRNKALRVSELLTTHTKKSGYTYIYKDMATMRNKFDCAMMN